MMTIRIKKINQIKKMIKMQKKFVMKKINEEKEFDIGTENN